MKESERWGKKSSFRDKQPIQSSTSYTAAGTSTAATDVAVLTLTSLFRAELLQNSSVKAQNCGKVWANNSNRWGKANKLY